ncbi:MAG: hypothetical protein KAJ18_06835 [Candidatus Omnitrophica bacterium]|nr:hypothetical protein [Candidatus Omnitrophota bacterium]
MSEEYRKKFKEQEAQLKALSVEIVQRDKEIERLLAGKEAFMSLVAHEVRTPLTIVKESLSQLIDGIGGPVNEEQGQLLEMALNNIKRLTYNINELLETAKESNND